MEPEKRRGSEERKPQPIYAPPEIAPGNTAERISVPPRAFLVICGLIIACYLHTLFYDFVRFDDDLIVIEKISYYQDLGNIAKSFTRDAYSNSSTGSGFYRPIQTLSFFLDAHLSGLNPLGFKITNLSIHVLSCLSLYLLLALLRFDYRISFLTATIYAVHPLFNFAVIWIPARGDLLLALFAIWSYITFVQYTRTRRMAYLVGHASTFALAVFSKETALMLPTVCLGHIFLNTRQRKSARYLPVLFSWALVLLAYFALRSRANLVLPGEGEFGLGPFVYNLATLPEFLFKFILPFRLALMPIFDPVTTSVGILMLCAVMWSVYRITSSERAVPVIGMCWFVLFTAIAMTYRNKLGSAAYDYLEHRTYLPAIGISMVLACLVQQIFGNRTKRVFIAGFTLTGLFCGITIARSRQFTDPMKFYTSALRSNPNSAMAYYNRAVYRRVLNDRSGAMADYDKAIEVKQDFAEAYNNRGNARQESGDLKGAMDDFNQAIHWNPGLGEAYLNRGNLELTQGDSQGAWEDYSQAFNLGVSSPEALNNRGRIYLASGQLDLAEQDFARALQINPSFGGAWRYRGSARFARKDVTGACEDWRAAARAGSAAASKLLAQHCR